MPTPFHSAFRLALAAPLFVCATAPLILPMTPAYAAQVSSSETTFNIAPGSLTGALNQFSSQAGIYLAGSNELAAGKTSQGLQGRYSTAQGLARLLQGTGLQAVPQGNAGYVLQPAADGGALQLDATAINAAAELASNGQGDTGYRLSLIHI